MEKFIESILKTPDKYTLAYAAKEVATIVEIAEGMLADQLTGMGLAMRQLGARQFDAPKMMSAHVEAIKSALAGDVSPIQHGALKAMLQAIYENPKARAWGNKGHVPLAQKSAPPDTDGHRGRTLPAYS